MARFEEYYHGSLERLRQLYDQEILTSWQIEHVEKHIHAMKESYETEIASLQEAAADMHAAAEAQSGELGKVRKVLREIAQGNFASIEAAQNAAKKVLHCDFVLFCEGYQEVPSSGGCDNCIAKQWEAAEVETAE